MCCIYIYIKVMRVGVGGDDEDVKGYSVDVNGYNVDVKGYSVDVMGYSVDLRATLCVCVISPFGREGL